MCLEHSFLHEPGECNFIGVAKRKIKQTRILLTLTPRLNTEGIHAKLYSDSLYAYKKPTYSAFSRLFCVRELFRSRNVNSKNNTITIINKFISLLLSYQPRKSSILHQCITAKSTVINLCLLHCNNKSPTEVIFFWEWCTQIIYTSIRKRISMQQLCNAYSAAVSNAAGNSCSWSCYRVCTTYPCVFRTNRNFSGANIGVTVTISSSLVHNVWL